MNFRLILFLLLFIISQGVLAQYYNTGQDPAALKWMQIKTDKFTLIYPKSYGQEGLKFAKSLDESMVKLSALFPEKKFRIPVVIHNYTTFSNGYVAWAPKRIEIYPTPDQNGLPMDPIEQLTTHELTHVFQMVSLKKGFSKAMYYVTGEQFIGLAAGLFLPQWFMEGEAVFAESLLSPSGRGRTSSFQKQLKAIVLENRKIYSYDKMISGSLKSYTPDHYEFGYQMIAWSFAKYGTQLWNKTLDITAKYPFTINPVNLSLSRNASLSKESLYSETFDSLKTIWQAELKKNNSRVYNAINRDKGREYVNYYSPVVVGKDSVVAIKTSLGTIPEFILINLSDNSEKRIHTPGSLYPFFISGFNGKIVWVEEQPSARWENRTFSVIKIMDIRRHTTIQLSDRSRYMAAAISPDAKLIAASENSVENKNSLVILNAASGEILNKVPVPENAYLQRPQWSAEGDQISVISLTEKGEGVMSYSVKNNTWNTLVEPGRNDLQSAFIRNDSLFFVSSSSGTDNIYLLPPDKKLTKISNSKYGAYDPFPSSGRIFFSDYTSSGYNICSLKINEALPYAGNETKDPSFLINRFDTIKIRNPELSLTDYKPVPYRKWGHLFQVHSWMPFYADVEKIQSDPAAVRPGFTIMSQNQLSTVITTVGYEYASDKTNQIHSKVTLTGWLPVIETQVDYGGNAGLSKMGSNVTDPLKIQPGLSFKNTISLPLNFARGSFWQYLRPSVTTEYKNDYIYLRDKGIYDYGQTFITGRLYFNNYQLTSLRDINPKWAQVIDLSGTYAPFDVNIYGSIQTIKTAFFFPGILRNQSIRLRYEGEIQHTQRLLYYNNASMPRSYVNIVPEKLNFLSADYIMPLIYPDLNIPGFIFVQRIHSSVFYDYASGTNNHYLDLKQVHRYTETFRSFGVELYTDFYLLRIPFMVSPGVRTTWKDTNSPPTFEFLFNIDIYGMKIGRKRL